MTNKNGFVSLKESMVTHTHLDGLVGLLVGDSMGVLWEFQSPERLPPRSLIEMNPPCRYNRSHRHIPCGTWSDDGAQALCLYASLIEMGRFSLVDFSAKLLLWRDHGYMAIDGDVFDIGNQTDEALDRLKAGIPAYESGGAEESDNGNGSLMRVLPLALWHQGSDEALVHDAHMQSLPTHGHARSMVACAYYCLVARGYMNRVDEVWSSADHSLMVIYQAMEDKQASTRFMNELWTLRNFGVSDIPRGTGYVLDTIWSARKAMEEDSFEDVIRTAILFGHDTDTTAAVSGGLAGIRFGLLGIPDRWLQSLRGYELFSTVALPKLVS